MQPSFTLFFNFSIFSATNLPVFASGRMWNSTSTWVLALKVDFTPLVGLLWSTWGYSSSLTAFHVGFVQIFKKQQVSECNCAERDVSVENKGDLRRLDPSFWSDLCFFHLMYSCCSRLEATNPVEDWVIWRECSENYNVLTLGFHITQLHNPAKSFYLCLQITIEFFSSS